MIHYKIKIDGVEMTFNEKDTKKVEKMLKDRREKLSVLGAFRKLLGIKI